MTESVSSQKKKVMFPLHADQTQPEVGSGPPSNYPEISDLEIQSSFDAITRRNLAIMTPCLVVIYVVNTIIQALPPAGEQRGLRTVASLLTAGTLLLIRWRLFQPTFRLTEVNLTGGFIAALILLNNLLDLAVTRDQFLTTNLLLLLSAFGFAAISVRLIITIVSATFIGWAVVSATFVHAAQGQAAFALALAAMLAIVATVYRVRFFRRMEIFRLSEAHRNSELVAALANTEKARQIAVSSRQAVEEMLQTIQRAEERFRSFTGLEGIAIHERGEILDANPALAEMFGYDPLEIIRMEALSLVAPESREQVRDYVRSGHEKPFETLGLKKNGATFPIEICATETRYRGRDAAVVSIRDVSDRHAAVQQLRDSEERHRQLFEISPVPMWVYDLETLAFLAVNQAAIRQYGYSREEFLAMTSRDIRPPEDMAQFVKTSAKDHRGLKNSGIWRHVKKDGTIIQVVLSSHELIFADRPARLVVANDITGRKRAEEALRNYTVRLRILRDIDQAILATQSPTEIANAVLPRLQKLIPFDRASLTTFDAEASEALVVAIHTTLRTAYHVGTRFRMTPARVDEMRRNRIVRVDDVNDLAAPSLGQETIRREGLRTYINVPIVSHGKLLASINIGAVKAGAFTPEHLDVAADVADLIALAIQNAQLYEAERKARAAAEAADRLKDEFLATVSHELRTPLNAIVGWNHLLRTRKLKPELVDRALETIERNAQAQARLINDLLDVSRIISGRLRLNVRTIEIASLLEATLDSVRPAAAAKAIRIEVSSGSAAGLISGDPDRLQQVLWNLLHNSIKFTPPGGRVKVLLASDSGHLAISVSDTGKGIAPEFLPYVFERFRQADSSNTRVYGGLGLGLSIVRHLVELHGGTVTAASEGEGCGATFTVGLPLAELRISDSGLRIAGLLSEDTTDNRRTLSRLSGLRVLIVEDESDTRELLELLLSQQGARVITTSSAEEGLSVFSRWPPDLLISDLAMPDRDGFWLIGKIREIEKSEGRQVPTIALTAYAKTEDRARILAAGFQLHIPKPFEPEELIVAVARLLGRSSREQTTRA